MQRMALSDDYIVEHMCSNQSMDAKGWLFIMNETMQKEEYTRMIVTLWVIWAAWRKVILEDISPNFICDPMLYQLISI